MTMWSQMGLGAKLSLLVALVPACWGVVYAIRPTEARLALMRPLSLAGLFGALSGFVMGLINMLTNSAMSNVPLGSPAQLAGFAWGSSGLSPMSSGMLRARTNVSGMWVPGLRAPVTCASKSTATW